MIQIKNAVDESRTCFPVQIVKRRFDQFISPFVCRISSEPQIANCLTSLFVHLTHLVFHFLNT